MLSVYPACFFKEDSGFSVIFPDLNYLSTCGRTIEEAICSAVECLAGYIYMCNLEASPIPVASSINSIQLKNIAQELGLEHTESFVNMISVDVGVYAKEHFEKSVKKTLSIPSWLNKAALEQNINFSQVLQEALLSKILAK